MNGTPVGRGWTVSFVPYWQRERLVFPLDGSSTSFSDACYFAGQMIRERKVARGTKPHIGADGGAAGGPADAGGTAHV